MQLRPRSIFFTLLVAFFCAVLLISNASLLGSWGNILANGDGGMEETVKYFLRRLVEGKDRLNLENTGFTCHSDVHTEVCLSTKPVRVSGNGLRVHIPSNRTRFTQKVLPYARKEDPTAMKEVTPVKIIYGETDPPKCDLIHNVTAVIFSTGGFSGNTFHLMNEIVIPLFLTSRHFGSRVQFVVTDYRWWFVEAYHKVLSGLSGFDVMDLSEDGRVHCFLGLVLGLRYHNNLALNPTEVPKGHSMLEFRQFLMDSHGISVKATRNSNSKPKLMLISRNTTRKIRNERSLVRLMEQVGFDVVIANETLMKSLEHFVKVINSCSVMVGVHGASLTHEIFVPDGAVVVQIVPLGMEWGAGVYYGGPATTMGLRHIEYRVGPTESSLSERYDRDHEVIRDPEAVFAKGYRAARAVYFEQQDVKVNLVRFRKTLVKALKLVGK